MRRSVIIAVSMAAIVVSGLACQAPTKRAKAGGKRPAGGNAYVFAGDANPTARSGRGEPALEDQFRPAAWVYIDGREGHFGSNDDHPQVQWSIEAPVSSTPTFVVGVYEPLLGIPKDFRCVLQSLEHTSPQYALAAKEGEFVVGKAYSLTSPGDEFVIRNLDTLDLVYEMAPLPPGQYLLAAVVGPPSAEKQAVAVTSFRVAEEE